MLNVFRYIQSQLERLVCKLSEGHCTNEAEPRSVRDIIVLISTPGRSLLLFTHILVR